MKFYKTTKSFISFVCVFALLVSLLTVPVAAADGKTVTATTSTSLKQGASGTFYVYIDSTEGLAALDVSVHFDASKIKVNSVYNSVSCLLYDNAKNTDNIQFNYIFDGKGSTSQTRLFYFSYQVLSNAAVGDTYFDISIGEAYDNSLNDLPVTGSRCKLSITESVTSKSCTVSSSNTVSTSVEKEFSLSYRFSTYQIASGSAVISYDPELFEVVEVTYGGFIDNKLADANTTLKGSVYVSFVGTQYNTKYDFITVKFKTIKNVDESSKITFKATELCDKDLNSISCKDYVTTTNISFDDTYIGNAPKMTVATTYDDATQKITAEIKLDENSRLGAGDFILSFDPELVSYSSYEKCFSPTFFNVNDKEVETGKFKFSIISLSDITTAENVIKVVFDAKHICGERLVEFGLSGSTLVDSSVNPIMLNFIGATITTSQPHNFSDWIVDINPTCVANGSRHKKCTVCKEVLLTESIDMLGHNEITLAAKAPTCTEIGWNEYVDCSRCDYTTYNEIAATGIHNHVAVTTQPTCTNQGYTTYTCSMCGDSCVTDYVDALGHTFDDDFDAICNKCDFERNAKIYGDTNGDSVLNNRDLALLMQHINGWKVIIDTDASDIKHDGKINNKDYALLMRKINGWENY